MSNLGWNEWGVIVMAASAAASFLMAYLTWRYVLKTADMVAEMAKTREETFRPYVVASLEVEKRSTVYLVVKNTGQTVAKNVTIVFDAEVKNMAGENIKALSFTEPIATLVPGWKFSTAIAPSEKMTKENGDDMKRQVAVTYYSASGVEYEETYSLHFALIRSRRWIEES